MGGMHRANSVAPARGAPTATASMSRRIGLLGGSFNPIHHGHLSIARSVADRLDLDRVLFLPSADPPHKAAGALTDAAHRIAMVKLAIEGDALLDFSDYDATRSGPSYTIDTVTHLQAQLGTDVRLFWIIGADWIADLAGWRRISDLVERCTIVTAARPGWSGFPREALGDALSESQVSALEANVLDTPMVDVSATEIRRRVAMGESIDAMVPAVVVEYIERNDLYGSA